MSSPGPDSSTSKNRRKGGLLGFADDAAGIVVSTSVAALFMVLADRYFRPEWDFSWADHWVGAPVLYLAPAGLAGLLWASIRLFPEGISRRFKVGQRQRAWIRAGVVAAMAGAGATPAALQTFSGAKVSSTWLGAAGPPLFIGAVFVAVYFITLILWREKRRAAWGKPFFSMVLAMSFLCLGCAALYVDMNYHVGLYEHLHVVLEVSAFVSFVAACQLVGFVLVRRVSQVVWVNRAISGCALVLGLTFVSYKPLRTWTDSQLAHAWVDEYYVGRVLRRAQLVELELTTGKSLRLARVDHLARRFHLKDRALDGEYSSPTPVSRGSIPLAVKNVVFFYVDTLRADVADDPKLMPNLAGFRHGALDFRRAYATGSDTLRSLPTITRGNYFLDQTHPGDLLRLAKQNDIWSELIAPKSAADFLSKLLPTFSFQGLDAVSDYDEGEDVWGYGAHEATANSLGDRTDAFLEGQKARKPFFLWVFHFDAHAWREIDEEYIKSERVRLGVPSAGKLNLRYRVIAKSIDEQFGRFLRKLKERDLHRSTAVVFLSDHGEGLGQGGFWVHSIFLWESLIHVPLVVRVPGVSPGRVETPVSLVDLAPTLAPIFGAKAGLYHGEPLFRSAAGDRRRLPLLLRGGSNDGHDRIGIVDPELGRKLVVRLEAAFVELYDYEFDRRDEENLARKEPEAVQALLQTLARSAVFPRSEPDFKLHATPREAKFPAFEEGLSARASR